MIGSEIAHPPIRQNVRAIGCRVNVGTGTEGLAGSFIDCRMTVVPNDLLMDGVPFAVIESVEIRFASFELYRRAYAHFNSGDMFELVGEWRPGGYVAIAVDGES